VLLLPLPLGPTMALNDLWKGPISCRPAYDLKLTSTSLWMTRRGLGPVAGGGAAGVAIRVWRGAAPRAGVLGGRT
jgi:hypothetical protein